MENKSNHLETRLTLLAEHFKVMGDATDLRYQQRFEAQKEALAAAFASQQIAMTTALAAAEKAVQAALQAAERAVGKAEMASEKRFEGVNEFRQTLSDQQLTFISRSEAGATFAALNDKIAELKDRLSQHTLRPEFEKLDEAVRQIQVEKANLDGRLVVITGSISTVITLILWALGKFFVSP